MTISFHDGSSQMFAGYCNKAWNDEGELRLNSALSQYDATLMTDYNTEEEMLTFLASPVLNGCRPDPNAVWTLGHVRDADRVDMIVLKGLHQWQRVGRTWNYNLHLTLGYDGWIWHLYCRWEDNTQQVKPTTRCTRGNYKAPVSHDGFSAQKRRRGGKR